MWLNYFRLQELKVAECQSLESEARNNLDTLIDNAKREKDKEINVHISEANAVYF